MKKNNLTLRKARALETKKILHDTAVKLFSEKGYDMVSVDDITSEAGTAKGTFYLYFKNKEHIILEEYQKIDDAYLDIFNNLDQTRSASENIITFVREQQAYALEHFGLDLLKVVYYSQLTPKKESISLINERRMLYKIVEKMVIKGQETGEFRTDISTKDLIRLITFMMRSFFYEWCINEGSFDLIQEGQKFFSLFIDGMVKVK